MKEAGIVRIWTSIPRRQNTVAQFIATRPILDLCEKAEIRPGARVPRRWWEQTGIDWKGVREKAEATEEAADPELTGTDLYSKADTLDGTARGTGGGGVPGRKRLQWSGVDRGRGLTPSGRYLKQVQNVVVF